MDFLFVIFFLIIAFNVFRNFTKAASKASKTKATPNKSLGDLKTRLEQISAQNSGQSNGDWSFGVPKTSNIKTHNIKPLRKPKRQAGTKSKDFGLDLSGRKSSNKDQNSHRRDDWGARQSREILSGKNIVIALCLSLIVFYVMSVT